MRSIRLVAVTGTGVLAVAVALLAPSALDGDHGRGHGGAAPRAQLAPAAQPRSEAPPEDCDTRSLRPSSATGDAIKRIKKRGRLIAGVDQNSYRWGYRDPVTGDLVGFDIDLAHAIAEDILGDPDDVTFLAIPTSQRVNALKNRTVDVVVRTMTINCQRLEQVAFSSPYFRAGQQVLAPKGSTIKGFDRTLSGQRVCVAKTSTAEGELEKGAKTLGVGRIVRVDNQLDCLVKLQLGEADAVITDNALGAGQVAQDPSVQLVDEPFTDEFYGVAMNKEDEDLVRRVNKVLNGYLTGGKKSRWMAAYRTWLAEALDEENPTLPEPRYRD